MWNNRIRRGDGSTSGIRTRRAVVMAMVVSLLVTSLSASPSAAQDDSAESDLLRLQTDQTDPTTGPGPVDPSTVIEVEPPGGSIVGGDPTTYAEHPYFVEYGNSFASSCGGSLIDPEWVLTAAHCVDSSRTEVQFMGTAPRVGILQIVVHPLWNGTLGDGHDLALLRVPPGTSTGAAVIQVGSPFRTQVYQPGQSAEAVGHGATNRSEGNTALRDVTVEVRSDQLMGGWYNPWWLPFINLYKDRLMIGAGSRNSGTCFGDSGGPLSGFVGSTKVQIGVSSFGSEFCNLPQVYGELNNANLAWIASEVPSVMSGWGPCTYAGSPGKPYANYLKGRASYVNRQDGSYHWDIRCNPLNPRPPQPDPDEEAPVCIKNPKKCKDLEIKAGRGAD